MQILVCDACGRVLEEEIKAFDGDWQRGYDLCIECKEKIEKIREEYNKKDNELEKQRKELYDEYKEKLKEIGLND